RLLETMSSAGDLEGALKVKEEMGHVKESPVELSENEKTGYRRLNDLRERRNDALEKAVGPINETYVSELRKLQKILTGTGDLEQAKLAKETLEVFQLNAEIGAGSVKIDELAVHHLVGTSWTQKNSAGTEVFKFEEGRFQVFKPDGSGGLKAGDFRNWQIENPERRQIRIFYHYGEEVATIDSRFTEMKSTKHVLRRIVK
ncbi:MAG: hypothetical protein P1V20_29685, partial [Verrucomicrobiales bacterium]|nr:hypothetical protein [Verrucomicrobiales bacterium]